MKRILLVLTLMLSGCSTLLGELPEKTDSVPTPSETSQVTTEPSESTERPTESTEPSATSNSPKPTTETSGDQKRNQQWSDCPDVGTSTGDLPDLELECITGDGKANLANIDTHGKPLVIQVWAQWCGPCHREAPRIAAASERFKGKVQFLGIDYRDPKPDLALKFVKDHGWKFPQLADPDAEVRGPLTVLGTPTTVFVSADGKRVHSHPGGWSSDEELAAAIKQHLGVSG